MQNRYLTQLIKQLKIVVPKNMKKNRLAVLNEYYTDEPDDPFNVYALALEYLKSDTQKAKGLFEELLTKHPNYVATYYHAAALYVDLGEIMNAEKTYQKGIKIAFDQQKTKAYDELKRAYQTFLDEEEF